MKKYTVFLIILMCYAFAKAQHTSTHKRAKIHLDEAHSLQQLSQMGVPVDHGIRKKGMFIISDFSTEEINMCIANGYEVTILHEDIKSFYKNQSREQSRNSRNTTCSQTDILTFETPQNFNQGSMGGYLTYQELLDELDDMASQYPNLITQKAQIGDFLTEGTPDNSVTPSIGGNPIYWLRISDNANTDEDETEVLYTSIHHAREPMSLMNLVFYMWFLLENYDTDQDIQNIVNNTELYFIPVINPDGYLYNQVTDPNGGGLWRKNRKDTNGVDNNRNYNYFINGDPNNGSWGGPGSSNNPNNQTYRGAAPFSEVENQAIKWFVEQHEFVLALNNHSFGELLFFPFGYANVPTPDEDLYLSLGSLLTSQNGYSEIRDSPFSGESDDFMYGTVGTHSKIFAFTPEIGTSFWPPASSIERICKEMMFLNLEAARVSQNHANIEDTSLTFIESITEAQASFSIQRLGITGNGTFTVSLEPVSSNIISNGSAITFTSLNELEITNGNIGYDLDPNIEDGDLIEYNLILDNGVYTTTIPFTKTFGISETLLSDPGDNTQNFENTNWGTTTATFVSASSSITDSPSGNYSNNLQSAITLSEPLDLTNALSASVSYYARWDIEDTWDYVQFEISTNGGSTWEPQCGRHTTAGSNNQPVGEPLYDSLQEEWVFEQIDLSDYLGQNIIARFNLVTDSGVTEDGFYFDDLAFNVIQEENLSVVDSNELSNSYTAFPNPTHDNVEITSRTANYTATVLNILGQEISSKSTNTGNLTIDLSTYTNGIYFVKLQEAANTSILKIIKH